MKAPIGIDDAARFRSTIASRLGLHFDESKLGYLGDVLQRRTEACREPATSYLDRMDSHEPLPGEVRALAQELTVSETYFFRHLDQFRAFAEIALPDRVAARADERRLSILSAGCSSGEETCSLAMLAREAPTEAGWEVAVLGVDISPAALERARSGRYSAWALRETPADLQRRWFRGEGREFLLDPLIRAAVRFEERNLAHDDASLWQPGAYDVVFCRNVIMYFTPEHARALVARITRALAPGGYLFLGHAETLRGLSHAYHLRHTHDTFYYQRKDTVGPAHVDDAPGRAWQPRAPAPVMDAGWAATWVETVQRASERIQALVDGHTRRAGAGVGPAPGVSPRLALGDALDLLAQERFSDALASMRDLPAEVAAAPEALLLRAVLLTHSGQLEISQQACKDLLAIDDLNAGAHYLLALCREGAGDRKGALEHDQIATYLDPAFAMPRLHMGLLARRDGDREAARRELGHALSLLECEETSRLLLFGGGFSREALVALCRAELAARGDDA